MTSPTPTNTSVTTGTMRAAVYTEYGLPRQVLQITETGRPAAGQSDLLVRVKAASVNALDWRLITGTPFIARISDGIRRPSRNIPGADVAGTVEWVGSQVTDFSLGDEVFAEIPGGGFAEYVSVPADKAVLKPAGIGMEQAATLGVAALTALQGLRDWGRLQSGQTVLVNGASGGVGTFAVQIARALGAAKVTAVCSTDKVEITRDLGADEVIDYTKEDFTEVAGPHDLFFDNAGMLPFAKCRKVITRDGIQVVTTGPMHRWFGPVRRIIWSSLRAIPEDRSYVGGKTASQSTPDLEVLKEMVESGAVRPVMDRIWDLDQSAEALHHQGKGHARGKSVVIP